MILENVIKAAVGFIVTGVLGWLVAVVKIQYAKLRALEDGMQCVLRGQIIQIHNRYMDKGYCPIYERENLTHAYEAYKALKGNGVIEGIYKQTMELPTEKKE